MAGQKRIAILVEDQYQVLEVWYPWLRLREEGMAVHFVGSGTKETYASKEGYPAKADKAINDVKTKDYDGVVIPGGFAPDFMRRNPKMAEFVREIHDEGKVVAAICHGGWMLVSAGILKNRTATCFFAIKDDLIAAGAKYVDQEVVVDKNLITSRKPEDLTTFVVEIIKQLKKS
ncbi:MAG TPA: type 1 glutamine amidotransferase domain-containing protein [Candidatus Omnitrophota bacterium]|nr:type 1 glutamine amidotransferase domain-containing protein [Candidatus Omnitrophota bacterium]